MTTTGEQPGAHQSTPQARSSARRHRRRKPRRWALVGVLVVAATGVTWAEVQYLGPSHLDQQAAADGISQDSAGQQGGAAASGSDANANLVDFLLPKKVDYPATATSPQGYLGTRYAVLDQPKGSCGPAFAASAPAAATAHCTGYLTADYVRDGKPVEYSSVTVLYYPDRAAAARAASALLVGQTAQSALQFRQPGAGLAATVAQPSASPTAGAGSSSKAPQSQSSTPDSKSATASASAHPSASASASSAPPVAQDPANGATLVHVAAVGQAVTVVQTAYQDSSPLTADLQTPTWYLSYALAEALAWEPDQTGSGSTAP
ncbi:MULTISPECIES: hypothetical protein [Streptacidiphilus]|uniref:Uncharacterized protein n=2 Tax=Streptacidiphilus TaxID=228398 RepID=A0ABV6UJW7_9ACTN|nr:hypothetical protein [Streptacidiphilus jeojiense]